MTDTDTQLPPHDLEAEQAVIGSLLYDREAIAAVADWLREDAFWHTANGIIFRAMRVLWSKRRPCDLITLLDTLTTLDLLEQAGGFAYINSCLTAVPTAVHVVYYAEIVMRCARRRAVIDAAAQVMGTAWRHDEFDLDALTETIHAAGDRYTPPADESEIATMEGGVAYVRERAEQRWRGELRELILPTGIIDIDRKLMGGFRSGSLIINAASSGMGKTAWALQLATYAAEFGFNVLFIELEMDREALLNRMIAARAGVSFGVPYNTGVGDVRDREKYLEASEWVEKLPITIKTDITTTDAITAYCQRQKAPVDFIVVDHLGYVTDPNTPESQGKEVQLNNITKALKRIAVTHDIPVLALAELNRSVEMKAPFKPNGEHLKYSQSILYNCDYLLFLYRRKHYVDHHKLAGDPVEDLENIGSHRHKVELSMMKNRNGPVGQTEIAWEPSSMSFHAMKGIA